MIGGCILYPFATDKLERQMQYSRVAKSCDTNLGVLETANGMPIDSPVKSGGGCVVVNGKKPKSLSVESTHSK